MGRDAILVLPINKIEYAETSSTFEGELLCLVISIYINLQIYQPHQYMYDNLDNKSVARISNSVRHLYHGRLYHRRYKKNGGKIFYFFALDKIAFSLYIFHSIRSLIFRRRCSITDLGTIVFADLRF